MELSDWVIHTLERRSKIPRLKSMTQRTRTHIMEKLGCHSTGKSTARKLCILFLDTCKVGLFYLTMLKGLMLISVLLYASREILLHRFETVDGYDMDKIIAYLIFILVTSALGLVVLQLANWKSLTKYCYRRSEKSHLLIKLCSVLFPFHFAILELSRLKRLYKAHEMELQDVFNDIPESRLEEYIDAIIPPCSLNFR